MLAEAGLANALSVDRWAVVVRGSMGGIRAPEWAVSYPRRADALLPLACPAAAGAEQIAWANIRTQAIRSDPHWRGGDHHDAGPGQGPHTGLGLARRLAHVTCRGEPELAARFGRRAPGSENPWRGGRYLIETEQVTALVREVLPGSDRPGSKAA